jgi:filamentous hemagglutinin family protein
MPGFSIGQGGTVQFNNGAGATLNRVTGTDVSSIDGLLSATGSVYLINPNGVVIGKTGVVDTGGSFVASTLDVSNTNFLAGGDLTFSGTSSASVVNVGKIGALGGDVALVAAKVDNQGSISAANGAAGLIAGYQVVIHDGSLDGGKFAVLTGGPATSATNTGAIAAAEAELRANGGNVYALAGNTGGVIKATGVAAGGGKVVLYAEGGTTTANGEIDAVNADGSGGRVETSGASVNFDGLKVKAANWLIDPTDLTVDAAAAATISANLAGTSVTLQTTASGASGPGNMSNGPGDININAPISWSSGSTLTLDAYHGISITAPITVAGPGQVALKTNDGGSGGALSFGLTLGGFEGSLSYTGAPNTGQGLTINGQAYTLLYSLNDLHNLTQSNTQQENGAYALATSLDGTGTTYTAAVMPYRYWPFAGTLEGLGHVVSNLTINQPNGEDDALIENASGATIQNLGLVGGSITGGTNVGALVAQCDPCTISNVYETTPITVSANGGQVGGLVGAMEAGSSITNAFATGAINGGTAANFVGGLVGIVQGNVQGDSITNAFATGSVSGGAELGGLVGEASFLRLSNAFATGQVNANRFDAGGLIGAFESGWLSDVYATGQVLVGAGNGNRAGGVVGYDQAIQTGYHQLSGVYYDSATTGQPAGAGVLSIQGFGTAGYSASPTAGLQGALPAGFSSAAWGTGAGLYPYLLSFSPNGASSFQVVSGTAYNTGGAPYGGTQINLYSGGALIPGGVTIAGANGYFYDVLPAGTIGSSTKLTEVLNFGAPAAYTGVTFTDQPALTGGQLAGFNVTAGVLALTTGEGALSAANADLAASLGSGAYGTITTNLTSPIETIRATNPAGFTIDQSLSLAGLTVDSTQGITFDAAVKVSGAGQVTLTTNDGGSGGDYGFGLGPNGFAGSLTFTGTEGAGQGLTINTQHYTLIYTMADLLNMNANLGGDFALANSLDASGTTYTAALIGVSPNRGPAFSGALTGLGHTISNLDIDSTLTNNGSDLGLFANIGGTVRDIGLVSGSVTGGGYIGELAGQSSGVIDNVYATGSVASLSQRNNVGGLVGAQAGGTIENTFAAVDVANDAPGSSGAQSASVGGLVGWISSYATLTNVYATGSVNVGSADNQIGGLVGTADNGTTITGAHATGAVTGGSQDTDLGGLVGEGDGVIINSYATGQVSAGSLSGAIGGLVGNMNGPNGGQYTSISGSYATGNVSGGSRSYAVGGLVGNVVGGGSGGVVPITTSYAAGAVSSTGPGEYGAPPVFCSCGLSGVGGLVGEAQFASLTNVYATGPVTVAPATGASQGGTFVGGLLGFANSYVTLNGAYATGLVTVGPYSAYVGGLVGGGAGTSTDTSLANGYYDADTTGMPGGVQADGSTGLTTAQLQGALPAGFDPAAWATGPGLYPYLRSFYASGLAPSEKISGYAYAANGSAAVGATIGVYTGGVLLTGADATSGANGYYYYLAPPNSVTAATPVGVTETLSGAGAVSGFTFVDAPSVVGGNVAGLNVTSGVLNLSTHRSTASAVLGDVSAAFGAQAPSGFSGLWHIASAGGFTVDSPLTAGAVSINTGGAGNLVVSEPLTATGAVTLNSPGGSIVESGAGAITAPSLGGVANGYVTLNGANQVASVSGFTNAGSGGFGLTDSGLLTISGALSAGSGALSLKGMTSDGFVFNAPVTAGGVTSIQTQGGINLNSLLTSGGALQLYAFGGAISEGANGVISAPSLSGGAEGLNAPNANAIATLAGFGRTGASDPITLNDAQALTITGAVSSGSGFIQVTAPSLTVNAGVTATGNIGLTAQSNLTLNARVSATGNETLTATTGSISEGSGGVAWAVGLTTGSAGATTLNGANHVSQILGAAANGFSFNDTVRLEVDGAVGAGTGNLTLTGTTTGGFYFDAPITAAGTGTFSTPGGIVFNSSATFGGALSVTSTTYGVSEGPAGTISAPSLTGSAVAGLDLMGANQIGSIAGFSTPGNFNFTDSSALQVTGALTASGEITLISGGAIVIAAPVGAPSTITLTSGGEITEPNPGQITTHTIYVKAQTGVDLTGPNVIVNVGGDSTASGPNVINR